MAHWQHPGFLGYVPANTSGDDGSRGDAVNEELVRRVNGSGSVYPTHTRVNGRFVLRLAVGAPLTEQRHVAAAWRLIAGLADGLVAVRQI